MSMHIVYHIYREDVKGIFIPRREPGPRARVAGGKYIPILSYIPYIPYIYAFVKGKYSHFVIFIPRGESKTTDLTHIGFLKALIYNAS